MWYSLVSATRPLFHTEPKVKAAPHGPAIVASRADLFHALAWRVAALSRMALAWGTRLRPRPLVSILTFPTPGLMRPSRCAAAFERSRCRPGTCGPRSLIVTVTDWPVLTLVIVASVPSGSVRWAAVSAY